MSRGIKITHLSKYYKPYAGGVETVVKDISEGSDYDVRVIATDDKNLCKKEIINGVEVFRSKEYINVASTSISFGYILDVFRLSDSDVFHVHLPNPLANLSLLLLFVVKKRKYLPRIVLHWHSDIIKQKKLLLLYKPFQTWLLSRAESIIVTSQNYLDGSQELVPFRDKCSVIPIGIDSISTKVRPDLVNKVRKTYSGKKIVFSLGRHIYYKGFEYLIEAAVNVKDAVFLIGGNGPDTHKYKELIKRYSLQDKVFLIGRVSDEDLPSYYSAADVFVFPSVEKSEAFGVVQLEAMSVGTPVVSTAIEGSGVSWVNKHRSSGLICQPKNAVSLAESLNLILNDESLRNTLSHGARNRYCEHFKKEHMVTSVDKIYKHLGEA